MNEYKEVIDCGSTCYLSRPIAIHNNLALEYDFRYRQPLRQYRLAGAALEMMQQAVRGNYETISSLPVAAIRRLPGLAVYSLPIELKKRLDLAIVDSSIGGPSMWGEHVARRHWAAGHRCLLMSYHRQEFLFCERPIPIPDPWSKFTFAHCVRALLQMLKPMRLLVVGREVSSKLFDLFSTIPTTVVETGFAEDSVIAERPSQSVLDRALIEVLFRDATFPWDSLAHSFSAAASIREADLNVLWSETVFQTIRGKFPEASVRFIPPSADTARFQFSASASRAPLRILLGGGAHGLGEGGRDFLAVQPLVEAAARVDGCCVSILTADTTRLRAALGDVPHVRVLPRVRWDAMPAIFAEHDVYYRVQNDESLPTSCLEAMSIGLPVIVNERAKAAFSGVRSGENAFCVRFADIEQLTSILTRLNAEQSLRYRVGAAGARLVREYCDLDKNLAAIGLGV